MSPRVSIIVPCLNEKHTIGWLLEALVHQKYPTGDIEVVIADGMSTDGTREAISEFVKQNPDLSVRVVDNLQRSIPSALNRAIENSSGEVIIRLDAHSIPADDYIESCLMELERTGAANVGGRWDIQPGSESWVARAIGAAAAHPLGAGDARYRAGGPAGEVETVPFGAFARRWYDRVGPFDESLHSNEDYEFNTRLRLAGGKVWFSPKIRSTYFARRTFMALVRQYARYGFWKARMLVRYPRSLRWRQLIPALFVAIPLVLLVSTIWLPLAWPLLGLYVGSYLLVSVGFGIALAIQREEPLMALGFPLALAAMHCAWGAAFWWSLVTRLLGGSGRGRSA